MSKYVLAPDSFKGTMTAQEVCELMRRAILAAEPEARVVSIPVADGGEGSVDCFLQATGGRRVELPVTGPFLSETVNGFYGLLQNGRTAVVEMAACAGLPLVDGRADPMNTTTYGVGELMLAAAGSGAAKLILGLGGSATNDGGCGAAAAAGVRFTDKAGNAFVPVGGTLAGIAHIDLSGLDARLRGKEIVAMCDIDNPLCGEAGAAHVFAPQKGASPQEVALLDAGLRHLGELIERDLGKRVAQLPGAGAAGGMGAGAAAFFGATLQKGIDVVLETAGFDAVVEGASLVFTGEGKLDAQSLRGKVVIGVAGRAQAKGVPVVAVVGDIGDHIEAAYQMGVSAILSINRVAVDFPTAKQRSRQDLALTMENFMRLKAALCGADW